MTSSPWVRAVLVGAVGLVVGLVLGGVGPRAEVRRLEKRVFDLERAAAREGPTLSREITNLLTNPGRLGADPLDLGPSSPRLPADELDRPGQEPEEDGRFEDEDPDDPASVKEPRPTFRDELGHAREVLGVRAAQARAALHEDIDPTGEQVARIDAVVDDMNDQLFSVTRDFLERTRAGETMPRRDTMALGADVLDILTTAESRMLDEMTPSQREAVREEATDPTSFLDPSLIDLLGEYEDLPDRLREARP